MGERSSAEYSKTLRKNIDNFSLEDSLKRVERDSQSTAQLQNTSNTLSQEEQELYQQTVQDRFKSYPMYEKGQHRPPGSPPERLNLHPNYSRTERNWRDTQDRRSLETEANRPFYPTFGTSGGGAPLRDEEGNKITNLKSDPETRFQPHKDGNIINEKAFRYIADISHTNEYIKELDEAIKEKQRQKQLEKEREEVMNAMHKRVDYFGQTGAGAPPTMRGLDTYTGVDLHQGYRKTDPVYTDRSVVRHYDLQSYTRPGDKWRIPEGTEQHRQYGTEDPRLGLLPIGAEVKDEMRDRKEEHQFLQDTKRTPRQRQTSELYSPWGRPGAGAPLYQGTGEVNAKLAGKFKTDFYNLDWHENRDSRLEVNKRNYLQDLKSNMVAHERQKQQIQQQQRMESALDLAEKIRQLDASGYPKRSASGELIADPRNLSDISRHKLDVRHPNPLEAKKYHDYLTSQVEEKDSIDYRQRERDMQEKRQHSITMNSYFWKPEGHGAPYPERPYGHRRAKLGSQLLQGFQQEKSPLISQLPSATSISQPQIHAREKRSSNVSMSTQTERQYALRAPFATSVF